MARWKILYTIPNFDTAGSGKALFNIVKHLDREIFEPHIACFNDKGAFFNVVKQSKIPIHIFEFTAQMSNRFKGIMEVWRISNKIKMINPDLIHSFHYSSDYSEALASRIAGVPWVYTKKNMSWGGKSKNSWKLRSLLANHILVQNNEMIRKFFSNSKKITLVPRGVNTTDFSPRPKDKNLLGQYNISKENKVILVVANLVPVKGVEILLDAFEILCQEYSHLKLIIVGDNNNQYGKNLMKKKNHLQASKKIYFTGKVSEVQNYLSIADIFVLPTHNKGRKEGCPVSLIEAMSCGIPVIASNIPGVKDILKPFENTLFQPGDTLSLIEKFRNILSKYQTHHNQALDFRNYIENNYNLDCEVQKHQDIYTEILE